MRISRHLTVVSGALALALASCAQTPTSDESPSASPLPTVSDAPVVVDELGEGTREGDVELDVDGPTQVNFRRITIEPGAGTGLHCHYGQLVATVEEGVLTHYAPIYESGVHVYVAGDLIVEGSGYIHEGMNEGPEDLVLLVMYVTPEGKPLAETDLSLCDS
jgi:quercetin dioxygenase-like cupin family protein